MKRQSQALARLVPRAILCGLTAFATAPIWADTPQVVQVEEHWELVLGEPDSALSAPQTSMVMSPTGDSNGVYFLFTLNHRSEPEYSPGGFQVQLWDGDQLLDELKNNEGGTLSHNGEVIRWVQRLSVNEGSLNFKVFDGSSETWGSFGGDNFKLSVGTTGNDLSGYRPGVSLTESQVNFAENRVVSLTLTKIKWLTNDGEWHEINAPIPVDVSLDP
jgi:hypothetical protein